MFSEGTIYTLQIVAYGVSALSGTVAFLNWLFKRDAKVDSMRESDANRINSLRLRETKIRDQDQERNRKRRGSASPRLAPEKETTTEYIIRLLKDEPEAWSETSQLAQDGDLGRRIHAKHMYKNQRRGIELELIVFRKGDTTKDGFWQVLYKIIMRKPMVNSLNKDLSEEIYNALEEWTDMMIRRKSQA